MAKDVFPSVLFDRWWNKPRRIQARLAGDARFAVTQGAKSGDVLFALRDFFGVGGVYRNRRHDNHREDLLRYDVGKIGELVSVIVPFFETNRLRTAKRHDFEAFAKCVKL